MRKVFPSSKLIGKVIKPLSTKESVLFFVREDFMYPFGEKVSLQENDLIITFCLSNDTAKMKQWIYEL